MTPDTKLRQAHAFARVVAWHQDAAPRDAYAPGFARGRCDARLATTPGGVAPFSPLLRACRGGLSEAPNHRITFRCGAWEAFA